METTGSYILIYHLLSCSTIRWRTSVGNSPLTYSQLHSVISGLNQSWSQDHISPETCRLQHRDIDYTRTCLLPLLKPAVGSQICLHADCCWNLLCVRSILLFLINFRDALLTRCRRDVCSAAFTVSWCFMMDSYPSVMVNLKACTALRTRTLLS